MSDIVIKAENLGKRYIIGHHAERGGTTFREALLQQSRDFLNKTLDLAKGNPFIQGDIHEEVWALRDVNFDIRYGEAVGIIGRNGAGKSTLLKILSRITEPTTGRVTIRGRVASLLEVGTGFHSELSGRENIYLNGAILGMTRTEINRKFDEIVAFAEVEQYLDTPVKRYSSGMYLRLAFAVAAHLEPEILIVDEVLAVGDAAFQKKCLGKMEDVTSAGRTVLFVSHNMTAIGELCNRGILLQQGLVKVEDSISVVVKHYLSSGDSLSQEMSWSADHAPGNESIKLKHAYFIDSEYQKVPYGQIHRNLGLCIEYEVLTRIPFFSHGINVFSETDLHLFTSHDDQKYEKSAFVEPGLYRTVVWIPANLLQSGVVEFSFACFRYDPFLILFHTKSIVQIRMIESYDAPTRHEHYRGGLPGAVRPKLSWDLRLKIA